MYIFIMTTMNKRKAFQTSFGSNWRCQYFITSGITGNEYSNNKTLGNHSRQSKRKCNNTKISCRLMKLLTLNYNFECKHRTLLILANGDSSLFLYSIISKSRRCSKRIIWYLHKNHYTPYLIFSVYFQLSLVFSEFYVQLGV